MSKTLFILVSVLLVSSTFAFNLKKTISSDVAIEREIKELSAINWPFTTCGDGHWTIEKLTLSAQPARNTNDSITTVILWFYLFFQIGTAQDSISFKQVVLNVKLNGTPLHTENIAFAQSYDNGDTVEFKFSNFIPGFAPSGTYGMTFNFVNSAGQPEGCLAFSFKLWKLKNKKIKSPKESFFDMDSLYLF